jgi:hypothetical protein
MTALLDAEKLPLPSIQFGVAVHVTERNAYKILVGKPEGKGSLVDLVVNVLIILKRTFQK